MKQEKNMTFEKMTLEEKIKHFYSVAKRALVHWDMVEETSLKLLNFTENATFLVKPEGKEKKILRVHRLDYATESSIQTELKWLRDLKRDTDLSLASPIPSQNGRYVETIETPALKERRYVVCFEFMEGKAPVDSSDNNDGVGEFIKKIEKIPKGVTLPLFRKAAVIYGILGKISKKSSLGKEDRELYQKIGRIAATLHKQAANWKYPEYYDRMEWDFKGTFGVQWNNFYGVSYRSLKWLSQKDIYCLDQCVRLIEKRLDAYGKGRECYGMIHSDLRAANLLQNGKTITILDFDDCGRGWYMYDIAGVVALMEHRPDLDEVVREILKGYEEVRPLSTQDRQEIGTFIMMRRIGMLQSLIGRIGCVMGGSGEVAELTPEILAFYAKGTVVLAKEYLKKYQTIALPEQQIESVEIKSMHTA